jgi:hypothetical protein
MSHLDPNAGGPCQIPVERGPAYRQACPIRDYRADPGSDPRLVSQCPAWERAVPLPKLRDSQPHISTRQDACIVHRWVKRAGLDSSPYGALSIRRTKAAEIYEKTTV